VLGRIVTTADAAIRASLPPGDRAVRASVGSVDCAVHAKAKTALEVAEEIARAASARLPKDTGDLAPAIRETLDEHGGRRFNVIFDALDEAASPEQARAIIDQVALPLAETCSDAGVQVVVGTRRRDDGGNSWTGSAAPWKRSTSMIPGTSPRRTWPPTRWPACSWPVTSGRATSTSMTAWPGQSPTGSPRWRAATS